MKSIATIALSILCLATIPCLAKDDPKPNPFRNTLKQIPAAELPAKAAQLVKAAKMAEREATTIDVVKAAVEMNPAATPVIVGAIAKAVPEMAALAAGTAAAQQPKQAAAI